MPSPQLPCDIMLLWTLFVIFVIYFYVQVIKPHSHWRNRGVPHRKPWPIIGNMATNIFRYTTFADLIRELYDEIKGKYAGYYQFLQPVIMLKDPELIKQVTVKDFDSFLDHQDFITEEMDPIFGKNIFALKGTWFGLSRNRGDCGSFFRPEMAAYALHALPSFHW